MDALLCFQLVNVRNQSVVHELSLHELESLEAMSAVHIVDPLLAFAASDRGSIYALHFASAGNAVGPQTRRSSHGVCCMREVLPRGAGITALGSHRCDTDITGRRNSAKHA